MSRSRRDNEVFRNAMTGLPHANSSTKAHASPKELPIASPSASILLISPTNRILLLHRVRTSTSFASAHVFPGGHVSPQDGPLPPPTSPLRHVDSLTYRRAAIRECFEESGILLAHHCSSPSTLLSLPTPDLEAGRKAIHSELIPFTDWVAQRDGIIDTAGLIPFTRWLTPGNIPKRFSTQMYLYFLPLSDPSLPPETDKTQMHIPTPDGGIEHTAAQFLYPSEWLDLSLRGEIVLYPPQFFLLHLISAYLKPPQSPPSPSEPPTTTPLSSQRTHLLHFIYKDGSPPWPEKCISPTPLKRIENGRYLIMGMGDAGPEVEGTGRKGDEERVLKVELMGDVERGRKRPCPREVVWWRDVFGEGRKEKARL